jgi:hypothetical protein
MLRLLLVGRAPVLGVLIIDLLTSAVAQLVRASPHALPELPPLTIAGSVD